MQDNITGEYIYKINQYKIYKYTDNYYKLVKFKKPLRSAGYELQSDKNRGSKGTINDEKLSNNLRRAKASVFEYSMCNDWNYFCTFTINGKKYPRNDLKSYYKIFGQWLNNIQKKHGKITYLLIPELHKDRENWHMHGLINFYDDNTLKPFDYQNEVKYDFRTRKKLKELNDKGFLNWEDYENKFGFCSFGKVKSKEAVSAYILKYITKNIDTSHNGISLNSKLYYCSQGLHKKEEIKKGTISDNIATFHADFENDYVLITKLDKAQFLELNS